MPYDETVRTSGETPIGNEGDIPSQACAHDGRCGFKHLGHARSAFRTHVTDNHNVSLLDEAFFNRIHRFVFAIKHPGAAFKEIAFISGDLSYGSCRGSVSVKNLQWGGWFKRSMNGREQV